MDNNLPVVSVLMSTYNGEAFIREQIDSILNQKGVTVQLMIRDDGSADNTISICREYTEKNENVSFLEGTNLGVGGSFLELLKRAPRAGYYAYADQDDIWLEDKLARAVEVIQAVNAQEIPNEARRGYPILFANDNKGFSNETGSFPILYGGNQILVDKDGEGEQIRFCSAPPLNLYSSITNNNVYGCTMVMNEALRAVCCGGQLPDELVLKRKNHDAWTLYVAYCVGVFVFDLESKMLYRQHEAQVVGVKKVSRLKKPFVKAKRLFAKKNKGLRSQVAKDLLRNYSEQMNSEVRRHLEVLANAKSFSGVRALMKDDVLMQGFTESRIKVFIRGLLKWI